MINNTKAIEDISEEDKKFKEGNVKYDENIGKVNNVRWARPTKLVIIIKLVGSRFPCYVLSYFSLVIVVENN